MTQRIGIVGAGVIGLSTALRLAQTGRRVTLISGQSPGQTTSATAAAYWAPYWIGQYDRRWAAETLTHLRTLADDPRTGVTHQEAEEWLDATGARELDADVEDSYWWRTLPGVDWRRHAVDPPRTMRMPESDETIEFVERVAFRTVVARMPDYLDYLLGRFLDLPGADYQQRWVDSLEGLLEDFDRVVHCGGWQAVHLVGCEHPERREHRMPGERLEPGTGMRLLAGHVAVLEGVEGLPLVSLHHGPFRHTSLYIVPRRGSRHDIICGGTAIPTDPPPRDAPLEGDAELCRTILERCLAFEPRLRHARRVGRLMGLRPVRDSVRIEPDPDQPRIIHCYGHGGAGLTLSWGSAQAVMRILDEEDVAMKDRDI